VASGHLTEPTASSSTAPNNPAATSTSILGQASNSSEDHPAGPETTGSHSPSADPLETGSQNNTCTREMLQVLTKEELKELIKARKLTTAAIERRPKNGKFAVIQIHSGAALINLPLDLLSAILEAPQDQHPSQQDVNDILQSVSYS